MDVEQNVDYHSTDSNVRIVNSPGSSDRKVCEEMNHKQLSDEMGRFENRIRNVENAVSSTSRIHVAVDDALARLTNLDKKPD